jgi:acetyltransferase-like isoleucine patch superfamily enzyme
MDSIRVKAIIVVSYELIQRLLFSLPRYRVLDSIKALFLKGVGAKVGKRVTFYPGLWIAPGRNLILGDDVDLALEVLIVTSGGVSIGNRTLVGYRTQILSTNHIIPAVPGRIFGSGHIKKFVTIGDDVWIGSNCIVLPGVTIGSGAVVGAGSIITKDVPKNTIVAGNPARIIRSRG